MKASLLAHALGALGRRKARSFALGGGLAFAVALVAAVIFLTESLRAEAERARAAHPDIVVQKLVGGRPTTIPASERAKLGDIAGNMAYTASGGLPGWFVFPALALEILAGLAILVGWQTRWAALGLAVFTLAAGVLFHYLPAQGSSWHPIRHPCRAALYTSSA